MKRLHTDSAIRELGARVIPLIKDSDTASDVGLTYVLRDVGDVCAKYLVDTKILLGLENERAKARLEALLVSKVVYRLSDLKINGRNLSSIGASGKQIGDVLSSLLSAVIEGEVENEEVALLSMARKMI